MATAQLDNQIIPGLIALVSSMVTLVVTLGVTHLLKNSGKIICNVNSFELKAHKPDKAGGEETRHLMESEKVSIQFEFDLFNTSEVPKSLRALFIEFVPRKPYKSTFIQAYSLKKIDYSKTTFFTAPYEELKIINLPSKELLHYQIKGWLKKEEIRVLYSKADIFFRGQDPKGRQLRKKIFTYNCEGWMTR